MDGYEVEDQLLIMGEERQNMDQWQDLKAEKRERKLDGAEILNPGGVGAGC